jgi:tetratricopeptide (TPR) repeat protein
LAKWSDYKGNLDAAIKYMEQAMTIAESRGSISLKIWTYTNLADFYGHAGRVDEAYRHYLKTLALQPDNSYAKKGIAWITYAAEKNTIEANRILDSIMVNHHVPDYYLLKAEMAEYNHQSSEAEAYLDSFVKQATETNYGGMYNAYLIEIYAETQPEKALALALTEIQNRATPETYHLLALAQLNIGKKTEALRIIETNVHGKTFEPMALYHSALVYKANGKTAMVKSLKEELLTATFELGPVLSKKVNEL